MATPGGLGTSSRLAASGVALERSVAAMSRSMLRDAVQDFFLILDVRLYFRSLCRRVFFAFGMDFGDVAVVVVVAVVVLSTILLLATAAAASNVSLSSKSSVM